MKSKSNPRLNLFLGRRYIDDDNYFKSNCNTQGEDKIKSESIENAKYIQNILL